MSFILYFTVAFVALSLLVFFHELGHYSAAKFFGVKVDRFSIGFGKVLVRKQCCGTEWAFSAIPLGGYVSMKGQNDLKLTSTDNANDSYTSKKPWQRIIILLAGPMANFIFAFVIYWMLALGSAPAIIAKDYLAPTISKVSLNSPAKKAGLKPGDIILSIDNDPIQYWYQIGEHVVSSGADMNFTVSRDGATLNMYVSTKYIDTKNRFNENIKKRIVGISTNADKNASIKFTPIQSLQYAWNETKKSSILITKGVQKITTGEVSPKEIGGAISIFDIMMKFTEKGIPYLLFIMAIISINLGIMNLLPIPALDGGHIMMNIYEIIFQKPPSQSAMHFITMLGWVMLLGLMGLGLFNDINRLWG